MDKSVETGGGPVLAFAGCLRYEYTVPVAALPGC